MNKLITNKIQYQELLTFLLNVRVLCLTKSLSLAAKSHFCVLITFDYFVYFIFSCSSLRKQFIHVCGWVSCDTFSSAKTPLHVIYWSCGDHTILVTIYHMCRIMNCMISQSYDLTNTSPLIESFFTIESVKNFILQKYIMFHLGTFLICKSICID